MKIRKLKQYFILPITKVKVTEITILLNSVVETLIKDLNQRSHVGKVFVHLRTIRKVANHLKIIASLSLKVIAHNKFISISKIDFRVTLLFLPDHSFH